jgi:exosortase H (IPTLxxWG-CTERM-specific)
VETAERKKVELEANRRLGGRFLFTFGVMMLLYFGATLDLQWKGNEGPGARPVAAALVATNQWVRGTLIEPYQRGIAAVAAALLGAIGHEAEARGREIRSSNFAVVITSGCDAIEPSLLLGAAILCSPAASRAKLAGFIVGAAAIASLNIVRVVTLWVIGRHWRAAFDTAHFTIWPFLIILFTAGAFLLWLRLVAKGRHAAPGPAA